MPVYIYRAVTKNGQVVRNRVEELNRFVLLKRLKNNELFPISVTQINIHKNKNAKKQKRNVESSSSILKSVRIQEIQKNNISKGERFKKLKEIFLSNLKITSRDIVVFTENFYLLKKANFNNIQALTTTIESTENSSLRSIIEDILIGVEAGDSMYSTMEYYSGVFPPIYINMIKVGELSRFFN